MGKFYAGRGKTEVNKFGNNECKINICLEDIPEAAKFKATNGKHYVNLTISKLKQPDDRGNTHSVQGWHKDEDYQPAPQQQYQQQQYQQPAPQQVPQQVPQQAPPTSFQNAPEDDCPF